MSLTAKRRNKGHTSGSATADFVALPPQKKRAFQMSAHEDSLELEYDVHSNADISTTFKGKEKLTTSWVDSKTFYVETEAGDKNLASIEVKPSAGSEVSLRTALETNDYYSVARYLFTSDSLAELRSTLQPSLLTPQLNSGIEKTVPLKDANVSTPLFGFDSTNVDKGPSSPASGSSVACLSSNMQMPRSIKSGVGSDSKPKCSKRISYKCYVAEDRYREIANSNVFDGDLLPASGLCFGGISSITNCRDPRLIEGSILAIEHYNTHFGLTYDFVEVVTANSQILSGFYYYITFVAKQGDNGKPQVFQAAVNDFIHGLKVLFCQGQPFPVSYYRPCVHKGGSIFRI